MIAEQLMSDEVPSLKMTDYCNTAINWMEIFKLSHLPVTSGNTFRGIISDTIIYDSNIFNQPVEKLKTKFIDISVAPHQHFFEIAELFSQMHLTALPVVKNSKQFLGLITLPILIDNFSKLFTAGSKGGIIVLEMHTNDYSLSEIAQIVESNDARILSCYISHIPDSMRIHVTIKINKNDLTSVLQTFDRYEYEVNGSFLPDNKIDDITEDRFNLFMRFLDS